MPLLRTLIDQRVTEAQTLRERIQHLATSDDVPEKARLLKETNDALFDVRRISDLVVSAFFERAKPKDRQTLRTAYAGQVERWLMHRGRDTVSEWGSGPAAMSFHWEIEFPEVFTRPNGGFDVFVGNPPFLGGKRISSSFGVSYRDWLADIHVQASSNADLVSHFYRRAFNLLREDGAFGLIATNSIAQGDTRSAGLYWISVHGGAIFSARKRVRWPGQAAVVVSVVHISKGRPNIAYELDGRPVDRITAFLFHAGSDGDPGRLAANASQSFIGSYVLGMGFTFDDTDSTGVANPVRLMHEVVEKDPRNAERIFPYIGGEEINESPSHAYHRYVIDFGNMTEADAAGYPDLFQIVQRKVKPTRDEKSGAYRVKWWQFARRSVEGTVAMRRLTRVIVNSQVSSHLAFVFARSSLVFAHTVNVFTFDNYSAFGVLQSRLHETWARFFASSLEDRLRYTPTDCFETFPFFQKWERDPNIDLVGREYYEFRSDLMIRNNEGLTKTYNRLHDPDEDSPDILKLRQLHDAMDRAVLDAYGWRDIQPRCEFILDHDDDDGEILGKPGKKKRPWRYRWPDEICDEVLGRLLDLNAKRVKEEALGSAGAASAASKKGRSGKTSGAPLLD